MAVPIALILGAAQFAMGAASKARARKEAARLQANRPEVGNSAYVQDALSLAESELAGGPGATERFYDASIDRGLSSSLSAVLKGGGNVNNVADVFDSSNRGRERLMMVSENLRMNRINNLSRAQEIAEHQRQQRFQFNEFAPWADAAKANAQSKQAAAAEMNQGFNTFGAGAMQWQQEIQAKKDYEDYFKSSPSYRSTQGSNFSGGMGYNSPNVNQGYIDPNYATSGFNSNSAVDLGYINPDYASGMFK